MYILWQTAQYRYLHQSRSEWFNLYTFVSHIHALCWKSWSSPDSKGSRLCMCFLLQIRIRSSDAAANSVTAARIKDGPYVWRRSVIKPVKKMRTLSRTSHPETLSVWRVKGMVRENVNFLLHIPCTPGCGTYFVAPYLGALLMLKYHRMVQNFACFCPHSHCLGSPSPHPFFSHLLPHIRHRSLSFLFIPLPGMRERERPNTPGSHPEDFRERCTSSTIRTTKFDN